MEKDLVRTNGVNILCSENRQNSLYLKYYEVGPVQMQNVPTYLLQISKVFCKGGIEYGLPFHLHSLYFEKINFRIVSIIAKNF